MGTLIHRIEYLAKGTLVTEALWTGPLQGIIDIARTNLAKKGADAARVVIEHTGVEVWSGRVDA